MSSRWLQPKPFCVGCDECKPFATFYTGGAPDDGLRMLFKSHASQFGREDICRTVPWPTGAILQDTHLSNRKAGDYYPMTMWVFVYPHAVCIVGQGWANRAEGMSRLLQRGFERVFAARSSTSLPLFSRAVSIDISDDASTRHATDANDYLDSNPIDLAFACRGESCRGLGLLPAFNFADYYEAGVGDYNSLAKRMAAAGSKPPIENACVWAGNPAASPLRQRYAELAAKLVGGVLAHRAHSSDAGGKYLSMEEQARRFACFIDLPGKGYSGRVPLLLHSGRPLIIVRGEWNNGTAEEARFIEWFSTQQQERRSNGNGNSAKPHSSSGSTLIPGVHHLASTFEDLLDVATRLLSDAPSAAALGKAGQAYAQRILTRDHAEVVAAEAVLDVGRPGWRLPPPPSPPPSPSSAAASTAPKPHSPPRLSAVLYLNRESDVSRRRRLLAALRGRRISPQAERISAFPAWRGLSKAAGGYIHAKAASVIQKVPRCAARLKKKPHDHERSTEGGGGVECTASRPQCCFDTRWTGMAPCEHKNMYNGDPNKATRYSLHACSTLSGHVLTFFMTLESIATRYDAGELRSGPVLLLEDDVSPSVFWSKHLSAFFDEYPQGTWDVAKIHGGGPMPDTSWRMALSEKAASGRDWWSELPVRAWGTAAMLIEPSRAAAVLSCLRSQPISTVDTMLTTAWARGELSIGLSREAVFYPQAIRRRLSLKSNRPHRPSPPPLLPLRQLIMLQRL